MSYDLILIGTGFASTFFLKKYLEKSPSTVKVLVLERGKFIPQQARLQKVRDEYFTKLPFNDPPDSIINTTPDKVWWFEANFGGGSNCWNGNTPRFMPNDFRMKSQYGVGVDWPITYEDIAPYYDETEAIMAISGPSETAYPRKSDYPLPSHQLSTVDRILAKEYGPLYFSQPTARASAATGQRGVCCTTTVCHLCPVDAKFTIENSLKHLYDDPRVELRMGAQVYQLGLYQDRVRSVHYYHQQKEQTVQGEVVAMGANPLFNAHILLNSGDSNPRTGKGLCEQVGIEATLYLDDLPNVGGSSSISANGYFMYDGDHRQDRAGCLIESYNGSFFRNEWGKWRNLMKLRFVYEDIPKEQNYVALSDDLTKPLVYFEGYSDYVQRAIDRLDSDIHHFFGMLPIEQVMVSNAVEPTEFHICATTPISMLASEGVVDQHLIHHQYRNLFVLGSGVYPTITPANPTLTLSALSLRAADQVF